MYLLISLVVILAISFWCLWITFDIKGKYKSITLKEKIIDVISIPAMIIVLIITFICGFIDELIKKVRMILNGN